MAIGKYLGYGGGGTSAADLGGEGGSYPSSHLGYFGTPYPSEELLRMMEMAQANMIPPAPPSLEQLVEYRLKRPIASMFRFFKCYPNENTDEVIVFLVRGDEPVTLKDGRDLFPSDALITQLRVLAQD